MFGFLLFCDMIPEGEGGGGRGRRLGKRIQVKRSKRGCALSTLNMNTRTVARYMRISPVVYFYDTFPHHHSDAHGEIMLDAWRDARHEL